MTAALTPTLLAGGDAALAAAAGSRPQAVGILGGMGPAAGADFVRLFVEACTETMQQLGLPVHDQGFPEHWLAQIPVPDRSAALALGPASTTDAPFAAMQHALEQFQTLGVRAVAVACNTAHAWHAPLQASVPQVELLHAPHETARHLWQQGVRDVGLMATTGTYGSGLYDEAFGRAGIRCHVPPAEDRDEIMRGIYAGVKAGDLGSAQASFGGVAARLAACHPGCAIVMGCTEIPLALPGTKAADGLWLVDPARVLASALARLAYRAG